MKFSFEKSLTLGAVQLLFLSVCAFGFGTAEAREWKILKTEWSASDESRYSDFVAALGKSDCRTMDACLKSAANPYRASDAPGVTFRSDCADLPYTLRAY